jgi:hypothetical protein
VRKKRRPHDNDKYWKRALLYAGIGCLLNIRGAKLFGLTLARPAIEEVTGITLEQAIEEYQSQQDEREKQEKERQEKIKKLIQEAFKNWEPTTSQTTSQQSKIPEKVKGLPLFKEIQINKDYKWLTVIPHPSVVVIIGRRGSGKSVLAYLLLELFRYRALSFVLGIPQQERELLPDWVGVVNDPNGIPQGSTLLVDEVYIRFNARESQKAANREISRIVNLSRQKQLTLIFVSQQASDLDKNLGGAADVLIIKEPAPLQCKFERREINEIIKDAASRFHLLSGDKKGWSLVYAPKANFFDMLPNGLPSLWSDKLSRIYASSGAVAETRPAKKMTKKEKIKRAKELNCMNIPINQIRKEIGVRSRTTVYNYLKMPDE